ncbi:Purine-cytosine permease fcyB [Talaromyces atroroseus]|uniref:Purine-cytosine permease fcyB n=1 Tax=Talaromyces atroroseus TaxID=1441469 RepID=A0A225AKQ3_TALAT|nr:Purine-cytosine permease fcyB [Talaromyces atroroseus]OKL62141.1 Purine-cytosine permease fcyB [Talaromyces atroroseus]
MAFQDSQPDSSHGSAGDAEKQAHTGTFFASDGEERFDQGDSLYARLQRLAGKFNIEQRGIERVPESERHDTSYANISTMWLAANMVVSAFAVGVLANELFYLGFVDAILVIIFFNLLGVLSVCFFSSLGPKFGLRQMVMTRFWFGWYGTKFIACINVLTCLGWATVDCIVGAQLFNAVNSNVPGYAGVLIIALLTFIITCMGYKVVHMYEYWSWIPTTIIFFIVLGTFAHSGDFVNIPMGTGTSELGDVLSFGATVYAFATGWTSYAADYTVYQPSNRPQRKTFFATWIGLIPALMFTEMLGAAVYTAASANDGVNKYAAGYAASGNGGLLAAALEPLGGFGKFCIVILALSIIANNCPNVYSVSLTLMVLGRWTQRIPRFIWVALVTAVSIGVAIPGYSHFDVYLNDFLDIIAYWLAIYTGVGVTEHFLFRRGISGYQPEDYDKPSKLPVGIAAFVAFCFGVAGMVTGMSETWWVGPIALHAGEAPYGGDVGFELSFIFAAVVYAAVRPFELKYFGR